MDSTKFFLSDLRYLVSPITVRRLTCEEIMSDYLAKYECKECGHEEYYDSDLKMGDDFCAHCEICTGDLKLIPRHVETLVMRINGVTESGLDYDGAISAGPDAWQCDCCSQFNPTNIYKCRFCGCA